MAGKARRVASRQAQLSRRRKRQQERQPGADSQGPDNTQTPVDVTPEVESRDPEAEVATPVDASESTAPPSNPETADAPTPARAASPPRSGRPRSQPRAAPASTAPVAVAARARREQPAAYNYIGAEFRRIIALASVVLAIIIVLGFIL